MNLTLTAQQVVDDAVGRVGASSAKMTVDVLKYAMQDLADLLILATPQEILDDNIAFDSVTIPSTPVPITTSLRFDLPDDCMKLLDMRDESGNPLDQESELTRLSNIGATANGKAFMKLGRYAVYAGTNSGDVVFGYCYLKFHPDIVNPASLIYVPRLMREAYRNAVAALMAAKSGNPQKWSECNNAMIADINMVYASCGRVPIRSGMTDLEQFTFRAMPMASPGGGK